MATRSLFVLVLAASLLGACARGSGGGYPTRPEVELQLDAGQPVVDAGDVIDPTDAGTTSPPELDAGTPAEPDAGTPAELDAGTDGGTDAGPPPTPDAGPPPSGCTPLPATGLVALRGDTSTGPTWNRPLASSCPASSRSSVADAVPYATHVLCNDGAAGTFDLEVDGDIPDSYLVVYRGEGMPADELACVDGDDDGGLSLGQAAVGGLSVAAGERITVVVTGFDNSDYGAYSLFVTRW